MKKIFLTLFTLLTTVTLWAQAPQRMSYQSVIRDGSNVVVASTPVGIKISLLQGTATGSVVYSETHRKATNANGLLSLEIGDGTAISGTFAGIDWANGPYLIKTETDPTGGTNYSIPGIAALNSVPYALFSANGTPGPQGATGPQGPIGSTGATGSQGPIGLTGPAGAIGASGAVGAQGIQGIQGEVGLQGLKGDKGDTGEQGPQGVFGPKGDKGDTGLKGDTGDQGIKGDKGDTGLKGDTGDQGIKGDKGDTGQKGDTGDQGIKGDKGDGFTDGTAAGQLMYWNGSAWVVVATTANEGAALQLIGGVPTWVGGTPPTAPGAPTIGTATGGDAEATVAFTAPASDGGAAITTYTATSSPGNITGTVSQAGSGTITVTGLTNGTAYTFTVTATNSVGTGAASAASNSVTPVAPPPPPPSVTSSTGRVWMDRNLGATQEATSSTDADSYGDLYQWGRGTDGHQIRTSGTTTTLSSTDAPGNDKYIRPPFSDPYDWRSPQNGNLWQGVSGVNNPCPTGYRLPTDAEWRAERATWSTNNAAGAFASPLKLPLAGHRNLFFGLNGVGTTGYYWSSTANYFGQIFQPSLLQFDSNSTFSITNYPAMGMSVRCIQDGAD
jgi:uncharacterized protein (TIGR02145 family)